MTVTVGTGAIVTAVAAATVIVSVNAIGTATVGMVRFFYFVFDMCSCIGNDAADRRRSDYHDDDRVSENPASLYPPSLKLTLSYMNVCLNYLYSADAATVLVRALALVLVAAPHRLVICVEAGAVVRVLGIAAAKKTASRARLVDQSTQTRTRRPR